MEILTAVGLVIAGFLILLASFATLGRFGLHPMKAGLLLLLMAFVSSFIGPMYDLLLWTVIQYITTVVWFLFYPKDPLATSRVYGPLVLCIGVVLSTAILFFAIAVPVAVALVAVTSAVIDGEVISVPIGGAVGAGGVIFLFGRRISKRWRLGADALRALDDEKK